MYENSYSFLKLWNKFPKEHFSHQKENRQTSVLWEDNKMNTNPIMLQICQYFVSQKQGTHDVSEENLDSLLADKSSPQILCKFSILFYKMLVFLLGKDVLLMPNISVNNSIYILLGICPISKYRAKLLIAFPFKKWMINSLNRIFRVDSYQLNIKNYAWIPQSHLLATKKISKRKQAKPPLHKKIIR